MGLSQSGGGWRIPRHSNFRVMYGIVGVTPKCVEGLVRRAGLEPATPVTASGPKTWCVYQFRHLRKAKPAIVACLLKSCPMNPRLDALHPYPFEKLRALLADAGKPTHDLPPINLSIGEPKHAAPACVGQAIAANLAGLSVYPSTKGEPALRQAISQWLSRRYSIPAPDPESEVLPVLGSRARRCSPSPRPSSIPRPRALVVCPNPFYQIYEGAALLVGATPYYVNADPARDFGYDWARVPTRSGAGPNGCSCVRRAIPPAT